MDQDLEETLATEEKPRQGYRLLLLGLGCTVLGLATVVLTKDPGEGGPLVVLLFLLLLFLLALLTSVLILRVVERKFSKRFSRIRVLYTGVALAAGVVFLIGLKTLGQLQAIDIALVFVFEFLLNFYLIRRF